MLTRKRVYDDPSPHDGFRVLVERLWPRGFTKERAHLDLWLREVAPSPELRQWFGHDPAKWTEFRRRYQAELAKEPAASAVQQLLSRARKGAVTLVYSARDEAHNSAALLQEHLEKRLRTHGQRRAA